MLKRERQNSGERTRHACWRSHSAIANFGIVRSFAAGVESDKFVAVEYGDQHATSVRSPERRRSTLQLCALLSTMVKIETIKHGPYIVTGEVELIDADGNKFPAEKRMALCRCGASTEKPFCDGTHSKIGFKAAEKAVPESKE